MNATLRRAPTLREAQQRMAALILNAAEENAETAALIAAPARGDAPERLRVYSGGYPARVEEALNEQFPAVAHLVGEGAFRGLVQRYIAAVPLRSYNLNDAGAELPRFLVADQLAAGLPFLSDLGRLEWHVTRAFHAHDEAPFDPAALAAWSLEEWERVVIRFQPSVAVVMSGWPIRELWECRHTPIEDIDIDLCDRADRVLVRRAGFTVRCESLDGPEAAVLGALLEGRTLGAAIAALASGGDDPAAVSAWCARWMAAQMVAGCDVFETPIG